MNNKPLFSVVTVCYNASNLIRKTIESVLAQASSFHESCGIEYVVQDGASKDDTLEIINEYKSRFETSGIKLIVNSENDHGIYDAMNKAVKASSGQYVIFMNADDCFYSENVLHDVANSLINNYGDSYIDDINVNVLDTAKLPDIIYGDCVVKELGMYFKFRKCRNLIKERMPFSHQACFAKRERLLEWPLNLDYPITADYDFLLKCHVNGCSFFDSDVIIALVTADGVSSVNMYDAFSEACKVCESYGIPRYSEAEMHKKEKEMKLKQFVLDCFPKLIKKAIRKYQVTHRGQCLDVTVPPWAH